MSIYLPTKDYSAMRGPCPDGFHVPTYDEWDYVIPYGIMYRENPPVTVERFIKEIRKALT